MGEGKLNLHEGTWTCDKCGRKFNLVVYKKSELRRTMSRNMSNMANIYRHVEACDRKHSHD